MAEIVIAASASHAPMMAADPGSAPPGSRERFFGALDRMRDRVAGSVDAVVMVSGEHFTNFFLDNLPPASYFTMVYGVFDVERGRFEYACCGHAPPLRLRGATGEAEPLGGDGPAVGLIDDTVRYATAEAPLEPGDVFVLYTDGITEAEDETGAEFGGGRLVELVKACRGRRADAVVTAIHEAVDGFRGAARPRGDDATVIVARVPPRA